VENVSRVQQRVFAEADDAPVERSELVKGYEYEKEKYVVIEKDELRNLTPETGRNVQIAEFVKLSSIDPVYFESSFYVVPEAAGAKPYALLYEALRESGYVGLATLAMQRREHVVVLRPGNRGIILHTMFYDSEIRRQDEFNADKGLVVERELEMAKLLIEAMAAEFEPAKFHDTYKEQLEALIEAKVAGRAVATAAAPKPKPTGDIMNALENSLKLARKPVASADEARPAAPGGKQHRRRR
jgi:DNA end-binding protein Ku